MLALKAWRDLLRHKGQFIGLILVVALGVMTFEGFLTGYLDLNASVERANRELLFADFSTRVLAAPAAEVRAVRRVPGVRAAEARLIVDVGLDLADGNRAVARLIGIPEDRPAAVNGLMLESGRMPAKGSRHEVLLHVKFATDTGLRPGDRLELKIGSRIERATVVGIATSAEYMYPVSEKGSMPSPREFAPVFVPQTSLERMLGRPGTVNDFAVVVDLGANALVVAQRVEDLLSHYGTTESIQRADQPSQFMIASEIEQNRVMAVFLPVIILAISTASMFITLSRLVTGQRGEIGLAKALGYSDGQLFAHYLFFSVVVASVGAAIGIAGGDWLARVMAKQYIDILGIPMLDHHIYPSVVLGAVAVSLVACGLAGVVPAWRAVRIPPAEAMHADPNAALAGGRIPLPERLLARVLPRSFTFRIPLRNVFRSRRRSIYTVLGIAFALVITVATQASFDSIDVLIQEVPARSMLWDVSAGFEQPIAPARLAEIRRWRGVESAEGMLMLPVTVKHGMSSYESVIIATDPQLKSHGFKILSGKPVRDSLAGGGVVLPESIAKDIGVGLGERVDVKTPYIDDPVSLEVTSISEEALGAPIYVGTRVGRDLTAGGPERFNAVYLAVAPSATNRVKDELADLPGSTEVVVKAEMLSRLIEMMEFALFYQALLLGFGIMMAFVVVYNTFTANVAERTREIATMRTIGESNSRLAVMLSIENLLLALAGVPLGVWMGIEVTNSLYDQLSSEAYTLSASMRPQSVVAIVLGLVAVMLISEIPPLRKVFRLDLAEATKVME